MGMVFSQKEFVLFITSILMLYSFLIVDFMPKFDTLFFLNPFLRFFVLFMMLLASKFDMFVCVLIGFAFMMTKFSNEISKNKFIPEKNYSEKNSYILEDNIVNESKEIDFLHSLTNQEHLEKAQSNIVDKDAMETEIKTWEDGYGAQGLSL